MYLFYLRTSHEQTASSAVGEALLGLGAPPTNGEAGAFCMSTSDQGGVSLICAKFLRRLRRRAAVDTQSIAARFTR